MTANLLMQFTLNTPPVVRPTGCCFAPPIHVRFHGHTDFRTYTSVVLVPSACTQLFRQIVTSFVDMIFPDAIRTPFSSLWPLGDNPDTHGPVFSPCSELLRSLARQFHSAAILQRQSSKIVLFLQRFETVTSWEHCIDYNTTSARLSQLGYDLQPRCLEESFLPLHQRQTRTAKTHRSFRLSVFQLWQPKLRSDDLRSLSDYQDKHFHFHPWKAPLTFRFHVRPAPSSVPLSASVTAASGLCRWIAQRFNLTWDECLSLLHTVQIVENLFLFFFASLNAQSALTLFFCHDFLQLTALCSSL